MEAEATASDNRTIERIARKPMSEDRLVNIRTQFTHAQWRALHDLANENQATLQGIIVYALDQLFKGRGKLFADLPKSVKPGEAFTGDQPIK